MDINYKKYVNNLHHTLQGYRAIAIAFMFIRMLHIMLQYQAINKFIVTRLPITHV